MVYKMSLSSTGMKQCLRKLEFPLSSKEALTEIGQLVLSRSPTIQQMDLALDLMAEFLFLEVDRRGNKLIAMSAVSELRLLEILFDYLNDTRSDTARNTVFLALFSGTTVKKRLGILNKLVSISMGVNAYKILKSASAWMQQLGNTSINSCKLAEALVMDYFILVPSSNHQLSNVPIESPQFTANFFTAVAEIYYTEQRSELTFPSKCLLDTIVCWISENHRLCIAAQVIRSHLPRGAIAIEAITPFAGLLKWCILAPIYEQDNEIYSKLHLEVLNSILEIPVKNPPRAISTKHLMTPAGSICRYTVDLQIKAKMNNKTFDKSAVIRQDVNLQLALSRYAQCVQVALSVKCIYGNIDEFMDQLSTLLPPSRLFTIVINKYNRNKQLQQQNKQKELQQQQGQEQAKQERAKQEKKKHGHAKHGHAKHGQAKQDESKQKHSKQKQSEQKQSKQEQVEQGQAKQEQVKQEQAKQERAKQGQAKQEQDKQEQAKQERAKQEKKKQRQAKQEQDKQEQAKQERAKQEKKKQVHAKQGHSKQEQLKQN